MPLAICFRGHTCSPGRKTARWHHWNLFAIEGKLKWLSHLQHISVYLIWLGGTLVFISFIQSTLWNMKILKLLEYLPYTCLFHIDLIRYKAIQNHSWNLGVWRFVGLISFPPWRWLIILIRLWLPMGPPKAGENEGINPKKKQKPADTLEKRIHRNTIYSKLINK